MGKSLVSCFLRHSVYILINDKSQGSIAKHLISDELLYYTFIIQSASERICCVSRQINVSLLSTNIKLL